LAVGFSVVAIAMALRLPPGPVVSLIAALVNGSQVAIGLLLLCVTSAASLSEERASGSLDLLLSTPLPTSDVIRGQWWGAFRSVPLLAILPGLVAAALAYRSGRWIGPPLVAGLVLAYGAAITSLGLVLATRIAQVGRVLALCVGAVVGVTIGLPLVVAF